MTLEKLESDDIAICVNYICDEFASLGGDPKKVALKMEYAIEDKEGWKIVDDGMITGFVVVEVFGNNTLITSLVVTKDKRIGKATWLLFKKVLEVSENRNLVYIPIHKNMWASKLCTNGVVDKIRAKEWVDKLEDRYGR